MQDRLVLFMDSSNAPDHICLTICRRRGRGYETVNQLYDEEAKQVYKQLTGRNI